MSVHRLSEAPLSLSHVTSQPAPVFFFFFTQFQLQRHFLHVSFIDFYVFESLHINVIKASSLKFSTTTTTKKSQPSLQIWMISLREVQRWQMVGWVLQDNQK